MKKLLCMLLILLLACPLALAREEDVEYMQVTTQTAVVTSDRVNIRSGPGTKYFIVTVANSGDSYPVTRPYGDWYQIKMPDGTLAFYRKGETSAAQLQSLQTVMAVADDRLTRKLRAVVPHEPLLLLFGMRDELARCPLHIVLRRKLRVPRRLRAVERGAAELRLPVMRRGLGERNVHLPQQRTHGGLLLFAVAGAPAVLYGHGKTVIVRHGKCVIRVQQLPKRADTHARVLFLNDVVAVVA